jgi:hypothetical protein
MKTYEVTVRVEHEVAVEVDGKDVLDAGTKAMNKVAGLYDGVRSMICVEANALEPKRYSVVLTYSTCADNAGEALKFAEQAVESGEGYYVEILDDATDEKIVDGERSDITIEEDKHED